MRTEDQDAGPPSFPFSVEFDGLATVRFFECSGLSADPEPTERMQASLRRLRRPDAAAHIVELVLGQITTRGGRR